MFFRQKNVNTKANDTQQREKPVEPKPITLQEWIDKQGIGNWQFRGVKIEDVWPGLGGCHLKEMTIVILRED